MIKLWNKSGFLTKKGLLVALVIGAVTPKLLKADVQPCNNTSSIFKPCVEDYGLAYKTLTLIIQYMVIKVTEDELIDYIEEIYGDTWQWITTTKTTEQIAKEVDSFIRNKRRKHHTIA